MKRPFGRGPTTPGLGWLTILQVGWGVRIWDFWAASLGGSIHTAGAKLIFQKKDEQKQKLGREKTTEHGNHVGNARGRMQIATCHLGGRWVGTCVFLRNMFTGSVETRTSTSNWEKQHTTRWWFQIFFIFTKIPILIIVFQMGWNHQLDKL